MSSCTSFYSHLQPGRGVGDGKGRPDVLRFMGAPRVGHDWATDWTELNWDNLPGCCYHSNRKRGMKTCCRLVDIFSNSNLKLLAAAAAAASLQSCPTLCDPIDGSPPGSPVPGILQARILEWVAIPFSNAWRWKVKVKSLSPVRLWATPWTAAYRAPLSMGFSRQESWSGVPSCLHYSQECRAPKDTHS